MSAVSVTSKGPAANMKPARQAPSIIEDGATILNYTGPGLLVKQMHGGFAMKKAAMVGIKPAGRVSV